MHIVHRELPTLCGHRFLGVSSVLGAVLLINVIDPASAQGQGNLTITSPRPTLTFVADLAIPFQWEQFADHDGFVVRNGVTFESPFKIDSGAYDNSLVVTPHPFGPSYGAVGVGTPTPAKSLHLVHRNTPTIRFEQDFAATEAQIWDLGGNDFRFFLQDAMLNETPLTIEKGSPTNSLFVSRNGSLGMGTNLPNSIGVSSAEGKFLNVRAIGNTISTGVANGVFQGQLGAQNHFAHLGGPANLRIMRLQTTSGFTGFHALNDALNAYTRPNILMMKMSNGFIGLGVQNPSHPLHLASGARCTAAGVWTNASSRELKEDITPISSTQALDTVRKLEPVSYRYKSETDEQYTGFIAEDVPELVAMNDRKSLAAMDITAVLTRVVKDQQTKLETQESQLTEQQAQLKDQQQKLDKYETTVTELLRRLEAVEQSAAKR